jgi:hypothetical protein
LLQISPNWFLGYWTLDPGPSFKLGLSGWNELTATNALVEDEPIEAVLRMNKNPILPTRMFFFFHLLSAPKFSRFLPTTPSPPHSIVRVLESLSKSELGARVVVGVVACLELELLEPGSYGWSWSRTHTGPR